MDNVCEQWLRKRSDSFGKLRTICSAEFELDKYTGDAENHDHLPELDLRSRSPGPPARGFPPIERQHQARPPRTGTREATSSDQTFRGLEGGYGSEVDCWTDLVGSSVQEIPEKVPSPEQVSSGLGALW
ncbi:MAG: hypothetical protein Q9223_000127 [Gallowayella weberi]